MPRKLRVEYAVMWPLPSSDRRQEGKATVGALLSQAGLRHVHTNRNCVAEE